eukprot:GEMP01011397.1.p1 GENE.GEMP01011397.1~~GEMP01011397.1.p1  ORF type:complete len:546 (+),score=94.45 GEMP01011397.1:76-1638(+)
MESSKRLASDMPKKQPVIEDDLKICGIIGSKERAAWYCYDAANSVFGAFAMLVLVPLLLVKTAQLRAYNGENIPPSCQDLAEEKGNNWTVDCASSEKCEFVTTQPPADRVRIDKVCETCIIGIGKRIWTPTDAVNELVKLKRDVPFFGTNIDYLSYATWVVSISVLVQALVFVSMGSFADYGTYRKRMLLVCVCLGSVCNLLFMAAEDSNAYITVGILTILANVFFGLSVVVYNAYLPVLVDAHEKLCDVNVDALSPDEVEELQKFRTDHESEMSSKGFFYGYLGQFVGMVCGCSIVLVGEKMWSKEDLESNYYRNYRAAFVFVGVWWFLWSLPAFLWLKPRASAPLSVENSTPCAFATFGWRSMWRSLCLAKTHSNTWRMLVIFFLYSDMYSTSNVLGIFIANEKMCFNTLQLMLLAVIMLVMAAVGSYAVLYIQRKCGASVKGIIVTCLIAYACLSLCGLVGAWNTTFGFRAQWEIYVYASFYGFLFAPVSIYSRVLFADFIPPGHESSFFFLVRNYR